MTFDDAAGNDFAVMYVVTQYQKKKLYNSGGRFA